MTDYATAAEIEEYGGNAEMLRKKRKPPPLFGDNFKNAPFNGYFDGKKVKDEWCYFNRLRGCVDYDTRNHRKLQEYLVKKSQQAMASMNRGNRVAGKKTLKKSTRKTKKR